MRSNIKTHWLLLLVVALVLMLPPIHVLAQEAKEGLSLRLASGSYYNEVVRGEDNTFYLDVVNNSVKTITDIQFNADGPKDWFIEFRPQSITSISADNYQTIDVIIRPPESTSRGDYNVTFIAEAAQTRAVMNIFVRVGQGISVWMWIGIIIAAVAVAGFVFVFMRFGRQ